MNSSDKIRILILEDDDLFRSGLKLELEDYGRVVDSKEKNAAKALLLSGRFDLAFIDLHLDNSEEITLDLVKLASDNNIYPVVLSGYSNDEMIRLAYEFGCKDYLVKPYTDNSLKRIIKKFKAHKNKEKVREFIDQRYLTTDQKTKKNLEIIENIYDSDVPVFISGPTGSGKQIIAEIIHQLAHGEGKLHNFVDLNCAKFSDTTMESELFGHVKGAFTGATENKIGILEKAHGGTLFLDEIATMSSTMQDKLIKAIETKTFTPMGSHVVKKSNFRLISATSGDIFELESLGKFRKDLIYRLATTHIKLYPLSERKSDIPFLIDYFIRNHESRRRIIVSDEAMEKLLNHNWDGNIRELKHMVNLWQERGFTKIGIDNLPENITDERTNFKGTCKFLSKKHLSYINDHGINSFFDEILREAIPFFLNKNHQKVTETIRNMGISNEKYYKIISRFKKGKGYASK